MSDGIFFLELLSSVQPRAVNWSLVTKGVTGTFSSNLMRLKFPCDDLDNNNFLVLILFIMLSLKTWEQSDEEKKMNATYIISIARKLGCSIFLLPEDITEVFFINRTCILNMIILWC